MKLRLKTKATVATALIGLGALFFYACNEVGNGNGLNANGDVVQAARITISVTNFGIISAGGTQQFAAVVYDENGNVIAKAPVWSVVAGGGTISSTGLFTAGTVASEFPNTIKATSGSASVTASILIVNGPATLPARYLIDSVGPIFSQICGRCHVSGGAGWEATGGENGGLSLDPLADVYSTAVNKTAVEMGPSLRIMPGFPDSSWLFHKIADSIPEVGERMPLGGRLEDDEIAIIRKWIRFGAPLGDTSAAVP